MADIVTSQTIFQGPRHLTVKFTNLSDGTGETNVTKVNATNANGVVVQGQTFFPGVHLKIVKVDYAINNMGLRVQWHATTNQDALILSGWGTRDFTDIGGIQNPGTTALTGSTGSIDFSTVNPMLGSSYDVVLYMTKGVPQS